jgi:purine-binding chemotaxis protein CheW
MRSGVRGAERTRERGRGDDKELVQLAAFTVGSDWYAIDIMRIKEIIQPLPVTRVPKAPAFVEGVIELRGAILPILDMRKRFDLEPTPLGRASKYLIVAIEGPTPTATSGGTRAERQERQERQERWIVGLTVDSVREVVRVPRDELRSAPPMAFGEGSERYFSAVCQHRDRIVMVLDVDTLLSMSERISLAGFGREPRPPVGAGAAPAGRGS